MRISREGELLSNFLNDIVQMYGKTALTVSSDKLVAIHGIVTRMISKIGASYSSREQRQSDLLKDKYMAGIWRDENFQLNLLWRLNKDSFRYRPPTD